MSDPEELRRIGAKHSAVRYAEAIASAAAASEKIEALTEALAESEYQRELIESQFLAASWPEGLGQVFHAGTDEPDEQTHALLDLYSGEVWGRHTYGDRSEWSRFDSETSTRYEWPIAKLSGPYIRLKDDWYVVQLAKSVRVAEAQKKRINLALGLRPGFCEEGVRGYPSDTAAAVIRAYNVLRFEKDEAESRLLSAKREIERLTKALAEAADQTDGSE